MLQNVYKNAYIHVKIDQDRKRNQIAIQRGVRQIDFICLNLFTLDVLNKLS